MKTPVFASICIILFASYLQFYSFMRYKFSGIDGLKTEVAYLKSDLEKERFKGELAKFQHDDFKQHVATLVPQAVKSTQGKPENFQLRSLASVITEAPKVKFERASSIFEKAKEAFRAKKFEESNRSFAQLIRSYPESVHLIESHFLLAEGQFQSKEFESCLATVEQMVAKFPEHDLTGYGLLRLGKVFERQDRPEDAADVYQAVIRSYGDAGLKKQAKSLLQSVEL